MAIPYLIWHAAFLAGDALRGVTYSPAEYARMIITGMDYYTTFYFIPLLIQLYLLAPFLVRVAKRRPWRLLLLCGAAQLVSVAARWYLYVLAPANNALYGIPGAYHLATVMEPIYLPFMWATFFSLGIVFHMHIRSIRPYLNNRRIQLLLQSSAGVLWIVGIVVTAWLHDSTNLLWVGVPLTVVGGVWALTIVVLFVTCDRKLWQPLVQVSKLAPLTLGIYLLNVRAMHYFRLLLTTGGLDMTTWPRLIPFVIFYIIGIGVPLLLMYLVARSPVPRAHRYLFG